MAHSLSNAFPLLAHELAHPLARMGSEADTLALEAIKELERAYGPGPRYERAKGKIMLQRAQVRDAHEAAIGTLRLAQLLAQVEHGSAGLHFRLVHLSFLVKEAVKHSPLSALTVSVEVADGGDEIVCDQDLMQLAIRNLLMLGFKQRRFPKDLRVKLRHDAKDVVVALSYSIPSNNARIDMDDLNVLIAKRILELHEGTLRCSESEAPEIEIRWPYGLTAGRHGALRE